MVIIRHSSRRALQSIYTSKNIIANYGNYCNKRIFNTDLCLSQTERSEGEKGMIVKMEEKKKGSKLKIIIPIIVAIVALAIIGIVTFIIPKEGKEETPSKKELATSKYIDLR